MNDNTEQQFRAADAAVEQAVTALRNKIASIMVGTWEAVAPTYIRERFLMALCDEITKLIDDHDFAEGIGPEELKLSNALADYRDARAADRRS